MQTDGQHHSKPEALSAPVWDVLKTKKGREDVFNSIFTCLWFLSNEQCNDYADYDNRKITPTIAGRKYKSAS